MRREWVGFDLDGTLAEYDGWKGVDHIGDPIPAMVAQVHHELSLGMEVKIFTARIANCPEAIEPIRDWCFRNIGKVFLITNIKDQNMVRLYDDRAVSVMPNHGIMITLNQSFLPIVEK